MELKDRVWEALRQIRYPGYSRDIVSFGLVQRVTAQGDVVGVALAISHLDPKIQQSLEEEVRRAVRSLPEVRVAEVVRVGPPPRAGSVRPERLERSPHIARRVLAVASGKGGVGKSTLTANLAAALADEGLRVGLLDADVYGFSIARMLGVREPPELREGRLVPARRYGIQVVTMGMLVSAEQAVIWRGPMLHKALRTLLDEVLWDELDLLLLDLPPGTGDVPLSLAQSLPYAEWVVVTTPQPAAVEVAMRAARLAERLNLAVAGIIENLSGYQPDPDGPVTYPFGRGGGREAAALLGVPLWAEIPLDPALREAGDHGQPVLWYAPRSPSSQAFRRLAQLVTAVPTPERHPQEVKL